MGTNFIPFKESHVIDLPVKNVRNISVNEAGEITVLCADQLCILEKDGKLKKQQKLALEGRGLAVFKEQIFVGLGDKIGVYDAELNFQESWHSLGEKAALINLVADERDIFATDFGQKIVWRFNHDGGLVDQIDGKNKAPEKWGFLVPSPYFDVGLDEKGQLWVVNPGMHRIEHRSRDGKYIKAWGKFSMADDGFCGCCNPTHFVALTGGMFITSEKGIPRVKLLNEKGELLQVIASEKTFKRGTTGLDLEVDSKGAVYLLDPKQEKIRVYEQVKK